MATEDDSQITPREFDARIAEVRRAVDLARESSGESTKVELREFFEAMFLEGRRAIEIAERERTQAAITLRAEQRHAEGVAEREREKAAQALATALSQAIREGDERLREHIGNQVEQINAALAAVESRALLRSEASRTQLDDRFGYTEEAVAKAERANEKRFEAVNAFREQLADQATQFLPREVAEAQIAELRKLISLNTERLDIGRGEGDGQRVALRDARGKSEFTTSTLISVGVAVVAFIGVIVAFANLATN